MLPTILTIEGWLKSWMEMEVTQPRIMHGSKQCGLRCTTAAGAKSHVAQRTVWKMRRLPPHPQENACKYVCSVLAGPVSSQVIPSALQASAMSQALRKDIEVLYAVESIKPCKVDPLPSPHS